MEKVVSKKSMSHHQSSDCPGPRTQEGKSSFIIRHHCPRTMSLHPTSKQNNAVDTTTTPRVVLCCGLCRAQNMSLKRKG